MSIVAIYIINSALFGNMIAALFGVIGAIFWWLIIERRRVSGIYFDGVMAIRGRKPNWVLLGVDKPAKYLLQHYFIKYFFHGLVPSVILTAIYHYLTQVFGGDYTNTSLLLWALWLAVITFVAFAVKSARGKRFDDFYERCLEVATLSKSLSISITWKELDGLCSILKQTTSAQDGTGRSSVLEYDLGLYHRYIEWQCIKNFECAHVSEFTGSCILSYENESGGFAYWPNGKSMLSPTHKALTMLKKEGLLDTIIRDRHVEWIIKCIKPDGSFRDSAITTRVKPIKDSFHAVSSLNLLKGDSLVRDSGVEEFAWKHLKSADLFIDRAWYSANILRELGKLGVEERSFISQKVLEPKISLFLDLAVEKNPAETFYLLMLIMLISDDNINTFRKEFGPVYDKIQREFFLLPRMLCTS